MVFMTYPAVAMLELAKPMRARSAQPFYLLVVRQ
jgi:hypothetical protein